MTALYCEVYLLLQYVAVYTCMHVDVDGEEVCIRLQLIREVRIVKHPDGVFLRSYNYLSLPFHFLITIPDEFQVALREVVMIGKSHHLDFAWVSLKEVYERARMGNTCDEQYGVLLGKAFECNAVSFVFGENRLELPVSYA